MVKRVRAKWVKVTNGDLAKCYFCHEYNTHHALVYSNGDEVFCCESCVLKQTKNRTIRNRAKKQKKEKNKNKTRVNKTKVELFEGGLRA